MLKYKLQKLDGLTHEDIKKALKDIPIESYVKNTKPIVKKTKNYLE